MPIIFHDIPAEAGNGGQEVIGPAIYVDGEIEAQAQIRVQAAKAGQSDDDLDRHTKENTIRWSGTIAPQKWTTFYMKVVSPFATAAGLNLRVEVEVPLEKDEQQAKAQLEKIRSALRDLNLDDNIHLAP
jgi:hypothetical protein